MHTDKKDINTFNKNDELNSSMKDSYVYMLYVILIKKLKNYFRRMINKS